MTAVPKFAATDAQRARRRQLLQSAGPVGRMLLGDALGDAFGFGIEMQDAHWIRENVTDCMKWPSNPAMLASHKVNNVRGMYSDDCEMTVGVMMALVAHGTALDEAQLVAAWQQQWELARCRPLPAAPGGERAGHGSIKDVFRGKASIQEVKDLQAARPDPGNAPPMRALPLAFLAPADLERLAELNADATHPHPKARAASFLMATAARWLIVEQGSKDRIIAVARERLRASALRHEETDQHLQAVSELPDYHSFGQSLKKMPAEVHAVLCGPQPHADLKHCPGGQLGTDAVHGLPCHAMLTVGVVLYLLRFHRGPRDVLLASVQMGGDVDSIAALCLGVVAAEKLVFGTGGLPWRLLEELEGVEFLLARAREFEAWLRRQGLGTHKANAKKRPAAALLKRPAKSRK